MFRWVPLWTLPITIILAIGTVWLRLSVVRTTYTINLADQELRNLELAREQMELKVTGLRSPLRLEALARTRFGLTQPRAEQIVHLNTQSGGEARIAARPGGTQSHVIARSR